MKSKRIIAIVLLFLVLALVIGLVVRHIYKRSYYMQDSKWLKIARNAGFLNSPGMAVDSYAKAIEILREYGIDMRFFDKRDADGEYPSIAENASDEFVTLIIKGAKAKRLGIKTPEPLTTEIYTLDNKKFEFENFKLLTKAIAHFAKVKFQKGDMDKTILLGYANLALGIQSSAYYDVDFIHGYGIVCKDLGLKTLKECAKAQDDENMMKLLLEMREELDKEFEILKSAPPTVPSFWNLFSRCMKSKSGVNEFDQ